MSLKPMPWRKFPKIPLVKLLEIKWARDELGRPGVKTAAIMIYIALVFTSIEQSDKPTREMESGLTLDRLQELTDISRPLIIEALKTLVLFDLILVKGTERKKIYEILWHASVSWFKVPCRALMGQGVIKPFKLFMLRNKMEFDALKLFLYLASVRDNKNPYAMAAYETIHKRLGMSNGQIRKAIAFLLTSGMLANVDRKKDDENNFGPNHYYFMGYQDLFV
jgi:hypothetical protein